MANYKVYLSNSLYQDLDRITDYLMEYSPAASYQVYRSLMDAYHRLEIFPMLGPEAQEPELRQDHYRKLIVGDYVTLYRFIDGACFIDHVFHGKQDYRSCFSKWGKKPPENG